MIRRLVTWTESFARHKHKEFYLFAVAFTESSFFLVPPDVLIIAILSHGLKESWIRIASISTIGSVLGGLGGYVIGKLFFTYIGAPLVALYGLEGQLEHVGHLFQDNAFLAILVAAFTPIPYKVFTIGAGLFSLNLVTFTVASIIGRGARFFLVAFLSDRFGVKVKEMVVRFDKQLFFFGVGILVLAYFLTK
jgi:membrane protein YqaA with SNARE-associated domain